MYNLAPNYQLTAHESSYLALAPHHWWFLREQVPPGSEQLLTRALVSTKYLDRPSRRLTLPQSQPTVLLPTRAVHRPPGRPDERPSVPAGSQDAPMNPSGAQARHTDLDGVDISRVPRPTESQRGSRGEAPAIRRNRDKL